MTHTILRLRPLRGGIFRLLPVLAILALIPALAAAQDGCRFWEHPGGGTRNANFNMPDRALGYSWGNYSRRFTGAELKSGEPVIYKNAARVEVRAQGTDMSLYLYRGDNFDDEFQAIQCKRGNTCTIILGKAMRDKVGSLICSRDTRIDRAGSMIDMLGEFDKNHLIPSNLIADGMVASVHGLVRRQRAQFYNGRIEIRRGRMIWSTGHELCQAISCQPEADPWRRKYRDYLRFEYEGRGRLKADGRIYDMTVDIWLLPRLENGALVFDSTAYKVNAHGGSWADRIEREMKTAVRNAFPDVGSQVTQDVRRLIVSLLGADGRRILNNNTQLLFSHPCIAQMQRVGYPGHAYTPGQLSNICSGTTPERVAAPGIRLLKR